MLPVEPGNGGNSSAPVQSNVTVDPGQIRDFAKFLNEMSGEVGRIEARLNGYASDAGKVDFGLYQQSQAAAEQHRQSAAAARQNVGALRSRIDELTEGTNQLAKQYADLNELNRAMAADIAAALNGRARRGEN